MFILFHDILNLFYPELCIACGRKLVDQERWLCIECIGDLPRTKFHSDPENKVAGLFWGRVKVENATSWLFFRKGSRYQKLVHCMKYKGMQEVGEELGRLFALELADSPFRYADLVVPVPLHAKKLRQRGYNQSEWIAFGIASGLEKPLSTNNLIRVMHNPSQTRKNRYERWQNVEGIFSVSRPEELMNKHVLLVDDVVTTGSTLEASVAALLGSGAGKVSIATLACAEI
jgi:ComF family protein